MGLYGSTPKAPTAPDPLKTAAAQTSTNLATAQTNAILGNVNQITPDGTLTYSQSGQQFVSDPTGGTMYYRGPNGEISSTRPTVSSTTAGGSQSKMVPYYEEGTGKMKYRTETVPGAAKTTQTAADGWTEVGKGYYVPQYTATQTLSEINQKIKDQEDAASLNLGSIANEQSAKLRDYLKGGVDVSGLPARQYGVQGGGIQTQVKPTSGSIQYGFGDAGDITKSYSTDFSADRQRVEDALMARLNPSLERDRAAVQTQLANQGIKLGSTAYDRGLDEVSRQSTDARLGAILNAGQEQSRLVGLERDRATFQNSAQQQTYDQLQGRASFNNAAQGQEYGQNLSSASFANQAQQQQFGQSLTNANLNNSSRDAALQEQFALRNQPINEIASLMNGAQVSQPNFVNPNTPTMANVDYAGLQQANYQNQMAVYQAQMQQKNSLMGGILGLGGQIASAGIMASDRRLKRDIVRVGNTASGFNLYSYRYLNGDGLHIGVMADEVEPIQPEAVVILADGFKAVDYRKVA